MTDVPSHARNLSGRSRLRALRTGALAAALVGVLLFPPAPPLRAGPAGSVPALRFLSPARDAT